MLAAGGRNRFSRLATYSWEMDMRAAYRIVVMAAGVFGVWGCATDGVSFKNASKSNPETIRAYLSKPTGEGPFPAIMLLHGCTGLERDYYSMTWKGLNGHAEALNAAGFVTLIVDSHGSRGYSTQWSWQNSCGRGMGMGGRLQDVYGAIEYLEGLPFVRDGAVGAVGLSQGGGVVLEALNWWELQNRERLLAAGVAIYPPCNNKGGPFYSPALILVGDADDITPAIHCKRLIGGEKWRIEAQREMGEEVQGILPELVVYPGVHHSFDLPLRRQEIIPIGTVAPDSSARLDARKRMISFFAEHLGS